MPASSNSSTGRISLLVFRGTFVLMLLALIWQTVRHLQGYAEGQYDYWYGCINEMLVNWEGGLVRRGLFGELLYWARSVVTFPVDDAIVVAYYVGFAVLTALLVRIFKKNGWSLFILPFPMCLYVYLCDPYFMIGRRDAWLLILAYVSFKLYHRYVESGGWYRLIACNLSLIVAILLHEASFFFVFLIIFLHDFWHNIANGREILAGSWHVFCHWLAILFLLCIVVLCHGDDLLVREIWDSWCPYLGEAVTNELVKDSYMSMTMNWSLEYCITEIVWPNSWLSYFAWNLPTLPFNLYLFACLYYLVTRFNAIDLGFYRLEKYDRVQISNIVLVQFICVLPLLTLVFCDWGRALPYWIVSSLLFFHFFGNAEFAPPILSSLSVRLQGWIDKIPFLNTSWGYYILIMTLPLGFMHATISGVLPIVPNEMKHLIISDIMRMLA